MRTTTSYRLSTALLASASIAALTLTWTPSPALADKVGVAAAVKPDAFSGGDQVRIGNSIFFNQRINTSGTGLVQVLLVDGSTFTVGPGSDLVIDKFVYDPKKNEGEVVATFSKGVLRFVGGKISKHEGGVKINTPSGALAIRGGMAFMDDHLYAFVYNDEMVYRSNTGVVSRVFQIGNGIELTAAGRITRPVSPEEYAHFVTTFSGGGRVIVFKGDTKAAPHHNTYGKVKSENQIADITAEGTQTQNLAEIQDQEDKPASPRRRLRRRRRRLRRHHRRRRHRRLQPSTATRRESTRSKTTIRTRVPSGP
jgi:hypothetical protein